MSKWSRSISRLEQFVCNGFEVSIDRIGITYKLTITNKSNGSNTCTINNSDLSEAIDIMYEKFYLETLRLGGGGLR